MGELYTTAAGVRGACAKARALAPAEYPPDLPTTPLLAGAPAWYPFEHEAWGTGEVIRQSLRAAPALKRDASVRQAIVEVAGCRNLRRGRQPFVLALGFVGARDHAPALAELLSDPDVGGQAVDTLIKMRAAGYEARVAPLLRARHAWIRTVARRYVERF